MTETIMYKMMRLMTTIDNCGLSGKQGRDTVNLYAALDGILGETYYIWLKSLVNLLSFSKSQMMTRQIPKRGRMFEEKHYLPQFSKHFGS